MNLYLQVCKKMNLHCVLSNQLSVCSPVEKTCAGKNCIYKPSFPMQEILFCPHSFSAIRSLLTGAVVFAEVGVGRITGCFSEVKSRNPFGSINVVLQCSHQRA